MPEKEPTLSFIFNGRAFDFVKDRRNKTRIYKAEDGASFLRIGPAKEIQQEVIFHRHLIEKGYPVPMLIEEGELKTGEAYYLEASAGEKVFSQLFKKDLEESGAISEEMMDVYLKGESLYEWWQKMPQEV